MAAAAAELAAKFGAEVVLLRVISIPQDFPAAAANAVDALPAEVSQSAAESLAKLAAQYPRTRADAPLVYPGQPWRAIVDRAKQLDVDLIVVGSHGYGGWDRILGTTASKVADHADRSVLVIHEKRR